MDPHHFDDSTYHPDADPDSDFYLMRMGPDVDSTFHPDPDPDPNSDPSFQRKAQTLEKVLKQAHIPYILACHLQIGADPDPAYHFDVNPNTVLDHDFILMRMRMLIQVSKMMRTHSVPDLDADPDPQH